MNQHTDPQQPSAAPDRAPHGTGRETFDAEIPSRPVYWTAVILAATAILVLAAMWALKSGLDKYDRKQAPKASALQDEIDRQRAAGPAGPLLQPDPNREMREMRAEEDKILGTYGWADRASGVVRLPIADAMDRVAAQGLGAHPVAPPAAPAAAPAGGAH